MSAPVPFWPNTIPARFVVHPDSTVIAATLNERGVEVCEHGRNPCILRCGVRKRCEEPWQPIPQADRLEWLAKCTEELPNA